MGSARPSRAILGSPAHLVRADGVELCVQAFGDPRDPAILLIAGASASMDWWEDEFCQRLADGRRCVIRYDHRDTGRSTTFPAGSPGYTSEDLLADAVGVLDALRVPQAHLVGVSMGGMLAQQLAVHHPHRVASLVLIATSPGGPDNPDLPPISEHLQRYFATAKAPNWRNRAAVIESIVAGERAFAAPAYFDEERIRLLAERVVGRSNDVAAAMTNHWVIGGFDSVRTRLKEINVPTLVVHGTADPLFPYGHAEALVREIPAAELLTLPEVGHQTPPPAYWDTMVTAMLRHTSGRRQSQDRWTAWQLQQPELVTRSAPTTTLAGPSFDGFAAAGGPGAGAAPDRAADFRPGEGWFDAATDRGPMPPESTVPHPLLVTWVATRRGDDQPADTGQRAMVVGCGLGADAEYLAGLGYRTVAFDASQSAVNLARLRHPDSSVEYVVCDPRQTPDEWRQAFDLVIEVITVQSVPKEVRGTVIANVSQMVARGGVLLVIAAVADTTTPADQGPPWPLTRSDIDSFGSDGLVPVLIDTVFDPRNPGDRRWRAEFRRP